MSLGTPLSNLRGDGGSSWITGFIFIGFKATGIISWSWSFVLMPFWAPTAGLLTVVGVVLVVFTVLDIIGFIVDVVMEIAVTAVRAWMWVTRKGEQ